MKVFVDYSAGMIARVEAQDDDDDDEEPYAGFVDDLVCPDPEWC